MLKESNIYHILLLCAIAYVIYKLTCPKKPIKNTGTVENMDHTESPRKSSEVSKSDVLEDVVSEIISEPVLEKEDSAESETQEPKGIVSEVEDEIKQTSNLVNNFTPATTEGGANINAAFDKPIPKGADTNSINFNKNYLKKYDSAQYLPQEVNDEWFKTDFTVAQKVGNDKLINADKYVVGVDTVGQSLKNASHDLRGTIANPKYNVSPWLNSTYEPDYNIKPLC